MLFHIKCANCGTVYDLSGDNLRQCLQCGKCHEVFFVPAKDKMDTKGTYLAEPLPPGVIKISCPKCSSNYELTSEFIGQKVECVECSQLFVVKKPIPITPPQSRPSTAENRFADDRTVKLKRQSDGKPQGMIPDYGFYQQKTTPASKSMANIPDHFPVFCPQCGLKYEVTRELIGEQAECECSRLFKITAPLPTPQNSIAGKPAIRPQPKPEPPPPLPVAIPEKSFATELEKLMVKEQKSSSVEDRFIDDRTVKLKRQTDGKPQGMIPDYGLSKQAPTIAPNQANIPEHFPVFCPQCGLKYEVTRELVGEQAECECGRLFKIVAPLPARKGGNATTTPPASAPVPTPTRPAFQPPSVSAKKPIEEEVKTPITEERFNDDRTVKLKRQSGGKPQGMIPDYGLSQQKSQPVVPQQANIPENFSVFCPQCNSQYEVTRELIGEQAECECSCIFKIAAPAPKPKAPIKLEKKPIPQSTSAQQKSKAKPASKPIPPSLPWYMFWKRLFGKL